MAQGRREEPFGQKVGLGNERGFVIGKERLVRRQHGGCTFGMQSDQSVDGSLVKRVFAPAVSEYVRIKSNAEIFQQKKAMRRIGAVDVGSAKPAAAQIARCGDEAGAIGAGEPGERII